MNVIDRYAYMNRLAKVNPAGKAVIALVAIGLCLVLNRPIVGVLAVGWMFGLAVWLAGIPAKVFRRVLLAEAGFLLLTSVGVAVSIATRDHGVGWRLPVGRFWLVVTPESLEQMVRLMTRALGGASALNFLAFTTPLVDLVGLLRRMWLPEALIDVMVIMYRFIFVLLETLNKMVKAQSSRLGYAAGYRRGMQAAGTAGAQLFFSAMRRSQRLETALASRGFDGELRVLKSRHEVMPWFGIILVGLVGSLFVGFGLTAESLRMLRFFG